VVGAVVASLLAALLLIPSGAATAVGTPTAGNTATSAATAGRDLPVTSPTIACADLATKDFNGLDDAATSITSAAVVAKSGTNAYEYCQIKGTISPQIHFELRLPTTTYTGRYLQLGCGGYCGSVNVTTSPAATAGCAPLTDGSFAVGQDDEGHTGTGNSDVWATDPQLKVDFGYRSEHVFAQAAKAVIDAFYGAAPRYSYYSGCSDGGREALMEAQRYPDDFDGIMAGAAAFNQTALNGFEEAFLGTVDFRADGSVILPASKVDMLHNAVIAACADPGIGNGTIQDPDSCAFDPAVLACPDDKDQADCLTSEQITVVKKIYAGVTAPDGTHLYSGGEAYGSEPQWTGLVVPRAGQAQTDLFMYRIGSGFLRWLASWKGDPDLKPTASLFTVKNLKAYLKAFGGIYDATDPDLTAFYKSGGKLIQWHGLSDGFIPPTGSIAYRQAVLDTMGRTTADRFYRFYTIPGMFHCSGGYGATSLDLLSPLMDWTETGRAPDAITAASVSADGTTAYTRPVYPYPRQVKYSGQGDKDDAASYVAYTPKGKTADDAYDWAGGPFRTGYQLWCESDGLRMTCARRKSAG
jgi:feruloyl esterase